jgi:hypothetical protein
LIYPRLINPKDIGKCEACLKLHEEIVSLKSKIEKFSSVLMSFAKRSKSADLHSKRYFKRKFQNKNRNSKAHGHKVRCHCCGEVGHTTPHCHTIKVLVPKCLMMWVPKESTCFTNPNDPTYVGDLKFT